MGIIGDRKNKSKSATPSPGHKKIPPRPPKRGQSQDTFTGSSSSTLKEHLIELEERLRVHHDKLTGILGVGRVGFSKRESIEDYLSSCEKLTSSILYMEKKLDEQPTSEQVRRYRKIMTDMGYSIPEGIETYVRKSM